MTESESFKVKALGKSGDGQSAWQRYRQLMYGDASWGYCLKAELLTLLVGYLPGVVGLALRKLLYPSLFSQCGRGAVFGQGCTFRHAHKISLGDGVILDDRCVIDAKGEANQGIRIGNQVYVGRNTIIYCKGGDIVIGDQVNISSNCQIFSAQHLEIGSNTVIAAFCYLLSGGDYNPDQPDIPFASQTGMETARPTRIGANCWLAAGVIIPNGITLGDHVVTAAGAVVTNDIPANQLWGGIPARLIRTLADTTK